MYIYTIYVHTMMGYYMYIHIEHIVYIYYMAFDYLHFLSGYCFLISFVFYCIIIFELVPTSSLYMSNNMPL